MYSRSKQLLFTILCRQTRWIVSRHIPFATSSSSLLLFFRFESFDSLLVRKLFKGSCCLLLFQRVLLLLLLLTSQNIEQSLLKACHRIGHYLPTYRNNNNINNKLCSTKYSNWKNFSTKVDVDRGRGVGVGSRTLSPFFTTFNYWLTFTFASSSFPVEFEKYQIRNYCCYPLLTSIPPTSVPHCFNTCRNVSTYIRLCPH